MNFWSTHRYAQNLYDALIYVVLWDYVGISHRSCPSRYRMSRTSYTENLYPIVPHRYRAMNFTFVRVYVCLMYPKYTQKYFCWHLSLSSLLLDDVVHRLKVSLFLLGLLSWKSDNHSKKRTSHHLKPKAPKTISSKPTSMSQTKRTLRPHLWKISSLQSRKMMNE